MEIRRLRRPVGSLEALNSALASVLGMKLEEMTKKMLIEARHLLELPFVFP